MASGLHGLVTGQPGDYIRRFRHALRLAAGTRLCALALAGLVLAACAFDPPTIERTARENVGTENSAKSRLAARKGGQTAAAANAKQDDTIAVPGNEVAALEVDLTNFKERLIGLDSDEISDLMGTPGLERAEPPALIWQYRHPLCTVDIFMFDDGGGATVDHVEVRPAQQGAAVDEKSCFTALLANGKNGGQASGQASAPPAASTKADQQPIARSPSTPVNRRAVPSAAPPPGQPAATPSSARVPMPSTAAPSAAPKAPAPPPASAGDMDAASPEDTDVDFDMGTPPAPGAVPAAPPPSGSAAPPAVPPPSSSSLGLPPSNAALAARQPPAAEASADFDDPLAAPSLPPPKPAPSSPTASAGPPVLDAPRAAARPSPPPSNPAAPPPRSATLPTPTPGQVARATPPARPGASAKPVEILDDEDLPPDLLRGRRDDDPSYNDEDMVE